MDLLLAGKFDSVCQTMISLTPFRSVRNYQNSQVVL